ncbi:DNA topoisomerase 6 subunit B-like isoform X1 [Solanum tuberosum]|uniref:DNA topoisomerase 6 subunit B-like isoform X1 n=1 Tax=Solanum tuberosum TaxID=4113 RepID=UPI00073A4CF1|nr:PREDICTED: DNA topoisomerase 6 subunit B-like isoform X1 [Solanum tuberosum]XP_015161049.1 PREDICTED: DNA topoisomerase 6 subunit B-like isoform X1 [Solanum tuberosum]
MVTQDYIVFVFQGILLYYAFFSGMFLAFIYMKNGKTKTGGMVLKSRLSLKGTGQRTDEEIGRSKFNPMIGLGDHERRDEALYDDFETAKAREKRLAQEARVQAKNVALGKKVKDPAATKAAKGREALYYRVTCKDNGRGMPHDDIPNMFVRGLMCLPFPVNLQVETFACSCFLLCSNFFLFFLTCN